MRKFSNEESFISSFRRNKTEKGADFRNCFVESNNFAEGEHFEVEIETSICLYNFLHRGTKNKRGSLSIKIFVYLFSISS